jgi:hypothetical protein
MESRELVFGTLLFSMTRRCRCEGVYRSPEDRQGVHVLVCCRSWRRGTFHEIWFHVPHDMLPASTVLIDEVIRTVDVGGGLDFSRRGGGDIGSSYRSLEVKNFP